MEEQQVIDKLGNIAMRGLQQSTRSMQRSAVEIARASQPGSKTNMTRAVVELKQHEQAAKANIKTLETADKTLGALLDVKA